MDGKPDLIIGNYTDGNLVSSLMASKLGVTQVSLYAYRQIPYSSAYIYKCLCTRYFYNKR